MNKLKVNSEDPKIIIKETLKSELDFYNKCFSADASESFVKFREFIPEYYGERPNPDPKDKSPCIAIENLTYGVDQKGCSALDCKLGTSTVTVKCR